MADWQPARLFSTEGIESKADARRRATEALMAAMAAAPTAGRALLGALGVRADSRTSIESFVDVRLGRTAVDGVVVARKGRSEVSVAFVVRVADERLTSAQVKRVREAAAEHDINAVVTVSSEASGPDLGRGRSSVPVGHWPWGNVLSALVDQKVSDPEQARILGDLVSFLQHPDVGAGAGAADMGPDWAKVVQTARTSRLSARNAGVVDVARRWDQVARTVGTGLGAEIDRDVQLVLPKNEAKDADERLKGVVAQLVDGGRLEAVWSVADAAGDLAVVADLEGRRLVTVVAVEPPDGLGERATVGWLLDGLDDAPGDAVVEAWSARGREPLAVARLDELNRDMSLLSSSRTPTSFRILLAGEMGTARSTKGRTLGFVDSVAEIVERTWNDILGPLSGERTRKRSSTTTRRTGSGTTTTTRSSTTRTSSTGTRKSTSSRTRSTSSRSSSSSSRSSSSSGSRRKTAAELAAELRRER